MYIAQESVSVLEAVGWLVERRLVSERHACRLLRQPRSTQRRRPGGGVDTTSEAEARRLERAQAHPAWGCKATP